MVRTFSVGEIREKSITPIHAGIRWCTGILSLCNVWGPLHTSVFRKKRDSLLLGIYFTAQETATRSGSRVDLEISIKYRIIALV
jgi:hypothetical protein